MDFDPRDDDSRDDDRVASRDAYGDRHRDDDARSIGRGPRLPSLTLGADAALTRAARSL
jgi:hypothetical protein